LIAVIGVADPGSDMRLACLSAGPLETTAIILPYRRSSFRQTFGFAARQGRKAATARDGGLSALHSSALIGVDRLLGFFTSFPFIPRFCLDFLAPDFRSGTPSALPCFTYGRMGANAKRRYYTKRRGNLPCQLRPILASCGPPVGQSKWRWFIFCFQI
jgi:hypothetical protein